MKKTLLIAVMVGVAVAAAAPAPAVNLTAWGAMNIKAAYYKNVDLRLPIYLGGPPGTNNWGFGVGAADPAWNEDNAWVQMRTILFFGIRVSQDLYGVVGFQVDSARWGDTGATSDLSTLVPGAVGGAAGSGRAGAWGTDQIAVQVKNAYIDFKVPQVPARIRAGIQPLMLRPQVFIYKDAAGVSARIELAMDPVKLTITPVWLKIWEGVDNTEADDQDLYGIDLNLAFGNIKPGIFFFYQARRQRWDGTVAVEGDSKQWWIGPYIDAQIGPVAATLDFVYNGGVEDFQGASTFDDRDHEGWVLRGEAAYTLNKLRVGVGGLYGSGDDPTTNDIEGYQVPYQGESSALNTDFLIVMGDWGLVGPYGGTYNVFGFYKPFSNTGAGIWYVRAFADYQLTGWLKLMANAGYIGDTVDHGDTFGTDLDDDDSIGWELDVGAQASIYKNLVLCSAFGYLIGGKALSMGPGDRPQDPWAWVTTLSYIF